MKRRLLLAGVVVASIAVCAVGTGTARADDAAEAAWKAAHDTDPHIPLTPYEKHMRAEKIKAIADRAAASGQPVSSDPNASAGAAVFPDGATTASAPSSASVAANQVAQLTSYWCGPAAEKEALGQFSIYHTQQTMANQLGTTTDGTAWSGGPTSTGHPIPDVLNSYNVPIYYIPEPVPGSPSSGDISNYKSFIVADIGYPPAGPLVGDAWETPSSTYHLVGHPHDRTIFHWFDIRGYNTSGANTLYEDSVHGATSVSWYAGVPAYSTLSSTAIVHIVGGRGYVW
jgi:hypothetical protein